MPRGRKSEYAPEIAALICRRVIQGESIKQIALDPAMPVQSTIYVWLNDQPEFAEMYARAKRAQADLMAEDIVAIADDQDEDVNRSRLRVDARKWLMAKLAPRKYGDALDIKHSGGVRVNVFKDD
jgi:hypothetical protein